MTFRSITYRIEDSGSKHKEIRIDPRLLRYMGTFKKGKMHGQGTLVNKKDGSR